MMHFSRKFLANKMMEMIYIGKNGEISQRVIKIYGETDTKLFGYCYLRKGYRSFQKEQILAIEPYRKGKMKLFA